MLDQSDAVAQIKEQLEYLQKTQIEVTPFGSKFKNGSKVYIPGITALNAQEHTDIEWAAIQKHFETSAQTPEDQAAVKEELAFVAMIEQKLKIEAHSSPKVRA